MNFNDFIKQSIKDTKVVLHDEFDRNFERKGFFDQKWQNTQFPNGKGSLMARSNNLRRSLRADIQGEKIQFSSSLPYASIHNNGGEITVTAKMKRFFWALYYKASGAVVYNVKKKETANTQRNRKLTAEAEQWKALALKKTGSKIKIKQRQFIGWHPSLNPKIEAVFNTNLPELENYITKSLNSKK